MFYQFITARVNPYLDADLNVPACDALLTSKGPIKLNCALGNDKRVETKTFGPNPFIATEKAYASR